MNKTLAISVIVVVTMMLTMGYLVPQIAATDNPSHKSPLYLESCGRSTTDPCTVVVDVNRNGQCDQEDRRIQLPARVATTLPNCPGLEGPGL